MERIQLIRKIDGAIRVFLYILIFWLPYSPAIIETCVILSLILWLVKRILLFCEKSKSNCSLRGKLHRTWETIKPQATILNVPIAFFTAACLLSAAGSAFAGQSLHNFLTKTLEWFIVYFLVVEVFTDKKHVYIALAIFLFTAFSTVIDSLIQFYITNKDIFNGHVIEPGSRATAGFKTSNGLGGYLTLIIPGLLAWLLLVKQRFSYRLLTVVILCFLLWSLGVTFSRGAWVGAIFGGIFLLTFVVFQKKKINTYFSLGLLWTTIIFCALFILFLSHSSSQELLSRYRTAYWRLDLWKECLVMIKDKPLFGHGINTFMSIFQKYRVNPYEGPTYAHNCYIQLAVETGLIGLISFMWIILKMFVIAIKEVKVRITRDQNSAVLIIALLSGIFAFLVHSFMDTQFYSLQLSVYLWFMAGVLIVIYRNYDTPRKLAAGVHTNKQDKIGY